MDYKVLFFILSFLYNINYSLAFEYEEASIIDTNIETTDQLSKLIDEIHDCINNIHHKRDTLIVEIDDIIEKVSILTQENNRILIIKNEELEKYNALKVVYDGMENSNQNKRIKKKEMNNLKSIINELQENINNNASQTNEFSFQKSMLQMKSDILIDKESLLKNYLDNPITNEQYNVIRRDIKKVNNIINNIMNNDCYLNYDYLSSNTEDATFTNYSNHFDTFISSDDIAFNESVSNEIYNNNRNNVFDINNMNSILDILHMNANNR